MPPWAAPLAVLVGDAHEQPVVEHLDRQLVVGGAGHDARVPSGSRGPHCRFRGPDDLRRRRAERRSGRRRARSAPPCSAIRTPDSAATGFNVVVEALFRRPAGGGHHRAALRLPPGAGADGGDARPPSGSTSPPRSTPLAARVPDRPRALVGYSFGAGVALGVGDPDARGLVVVAPPLALMPVGSPPPMPTLRARAGPRPVLARRPSSARRRRLARRRPMEVVDRRRPLPRRPHRRRRRPRHRLAPARAVAP